MKTVNIHEAKTHLSRLIEEAVTNGESFVITKAGKPQVRVEALNRADRDKPLPKRKLGFMRGKMKIPDDFDTMLDDEIEDMFYGPLLPKEERT